MVRYLSIACLHSCETAVSTHFGSHQFDDLDKKEEIVASEAKSAVWVAQLTRYWLPVSESQVRFPVFVCGMALFAKSGTMLFLWFRMHIPISFTSTDHACPKMEHTDSEPVKVVCTV